VTCPEALPPSADWLAEAASVAPVWLAPAWFAVAWLELLWLPAVGAAEVRAAELLAGAELAGAELVGQLDAGVGALLVGLGRAVELDVTGAGELAAVAPAAEATFLPGGREVIGGRTFVTSATTGSGLSTSASAPSR
jgi:hypothetical protein